MNEELVILIKSYLQSVDEVLLLLKSKVGEPLEGRSWKANIPDNGSYPDVGIADLRRHGTGIWVSYKSKFIDFNFSDSNLLLSDDSQKFISIDVGFLTAFIESLGIKEEKWTDYSLLKEELDKLRDKGIVGYVNYKYYLNEDLDKVDMQTPGESTYFDLYPRP